MHVRSRRSGFTLIELLATLSILSILLTMVFLKWGGFRSFEEKMELQRVVKHINYGKNMSMIRREKVTVKLFLNDQKVVIYAEKGTIIKELPLHKIKFVNADSAIESLVFAPTGAPVSGSGTFFLEGVENKYKMTVDPILGRVRIYEKEE